MQDKVCQFFSCKYVFFQNFLVAELFLNLYQLEKYQGNKCKLKPNIFPITVSLNKIIFCLIILQL